MSKGLEIADERLARGEISDEEYDKIVSKIKEREGGNVPVETSEITSSTEPSSQIGISPSPPEAPEEFKIKKAGWFFWMLPVIFLLPFRLTQPTMSEMAGGYQIVIWAALALAAIGGVKMLFGED